MKWYVYAVLAGLVYLASKFARLLPHAYESVAVIGALILSFGVAPLLLRRARQASDRASALAATPAQAVLHRTGEKFSLYLRSFDLDAVRPSDGALNRHLLGALSMPSETEEVSLVAKLSVLAPVVAVGRPGSDGASQLGAYRYYVPDSEHWQDRVRALIMKAHLIIVRVGEMTPGLVWELENIRDQRQFSRTALIVCGCDDRDAAYAKLLPFFPAGMRAQMPACAEDIRAVYIDSLGKTHLLRKKMAVSATIEHWVTDALLEIMSSDGGPGDPPAAPAASYSIAGVRCWQGETIGWTPKGSFAGKIAISSDGFHFLSSGSSLIKELSAQRSSIASANATESLDMDALANSGSLTIAHADLLGMEVVGSLLQTPHIKIVFMDTSGEISHCSLALDGNARNTLENLNLIVKNAICMGQFAEDQTSLLPE